MTDKTEHDEFDTLLEFGCVTLQDLADDEHEVLTEDVYFFNEPKRKEIANPYPCSFITILALDYDNKQRTRSSVPLRMGRPNNPPRIRTRSPQK